MAIEFNNCYVKTLDNGGFTLGAPKEGGAGPPDPEEVLLAVKITETKVEFKSVMDVFCVTQFQLELEKPRVFRKNA